MEFVLSEGFNYGVNHFLLSERNIQSNVMSRIIQPVNVFFQLEHYAVIGPYPFKDPSPYSRPWSMTEIFASESAVSLPPT